jgi:hypothetical protein
MIAVLARDGMKIVVFREKRFSLRCNTRRTAPAIFGDWKRRANCLCCG